MWIILQAIWNVMAHAQKPDFVFRRKRGVHLNRRARQFSRLLRISGSNAGYKTFRVSEKGTGYPFLSSFFPSLPLPCVTVCHHISTGLYYLEVLLELIVLCLSKPHSTFIWKITIKWAKSKPICSNVFFPLSSSVVIYLPFKFYNFVESLKFITGLKNTSYCELVWSFSDIYLPFPSNVFWYYTLFFFFFFQTLNFL